MFIFTAVRNEVEYRRQRGGLRRELRADRKAKRKFNPDLDTSARIAEGSLYRGGGFFTTKSTPKF